MLTAPIHHQICLAIGLALDGLFKNGNRDGRAFGGIDGLDE